MVTRSDIENAQPLYLGSASDPRVIGFDAEKGTLYVYTGGQFGIPCLLQKQSDLGGDPYNWILVNTGGGGTSSTVVLVHTITPAEEIAKSFAVPSLPLNPLNVVGMAKNGVPLAPPGDFEIIGLNFVWTGHALDGILASGDVVMLVYNS